MSNLAYNLIYLIALWNSEVLGQLTQRCKCGNEFELNFEINLLEEELLCLMGGIGCYYFFPFHHFYLEVEQVFWLKLLSMQQLFIEIQYHWQFLLE